MDEERTGTEQQFVDHISSSLLSRVVENGAATASITMLSISKGNYQMVEQWIHEPKWVPYVTGFSIYCCISINLYVAYVDTLL